MLKNLILQLHKGAKIEELREKAKEILKGLSAKEIAEVEQELIKEGIPREEIRKLCDIHMEIFRKWIGRKNYASRMASYTYFNERARNSSFICRKFGEKY